MRERSFFNRRESLEDVAAQLSTSTQVVSVIPDEEHDGFQLLVDDRRSGYSRRHQVTADFVTTGEYRALIQSYRDVRDWLKGPVVIATTGSEPEVVDETQAADTAEESPRPPVDVQRPRAAAGDQEVRIETVDELLEFFIAAGKKGVAVNRYKGLGEMNPEQLWATTMKPEVRTLLQVRAEDHAEADQMFTTLMGDQVEPRRKFIEDNALAVKNLDV